MIKTKIIVANNVCVFLTCCLCPIRQCKRASNRYFFRIMLVNRGGVMDLDDEEEEELEWESNDKNDSIGMQ